MSTSSVSYLLSTQSDAVFIANMKGVYGFVELTDKEPKARDILDKVQQLGDGSPIRDIKQLLKKLIRFR